MVIYETESTKLIKLNHIIGYPSHPVAFHYNSGMDINAAKMFVDLFVKIRQNI